MALKIKKDDVVYVTTGKDKGKTGKVLAVDVNASRVMVEGINMIKRHQSQKKGFAESGIVEREAAMHLSNVMLLDPESGKPTRFRNGTDKDGNKIRISTKSGKTI